MKILRALAKTRIFNMFKDSSSTTLSHFKKYIKKT